MWRPAAGWRSAILPSHATPSIFAFARRAGVSRGIWMRDGLGRYSAQRQQNLLHRWSRRAGHGRRFRRAGARRRGSLAFAGLVVQVGNETSPVDAGGGTPAEMAGGLAAGIAAGAPISVAWQTRTEVLLPTCAWAQSKGDPLVPAICPRPTVAPPAGYLPPGEPGLPAYRPPDGLGLYPGPPPGRRLGSIPLAT